MSNDTTAERQTEKRTIEITRDVITVETDLNVPKGKPSLPIFVDQGWLDADVVAEDYPDYQVLRITDEETGAELQVTRSLVYPLGEANTIFTVLPEHNKYHIQQTGETGNSGVGETAVAGDFYVDYREANDRWDGMRWTGGTNQLRVRFRSTVSDPVPKVLIKEPGAVSPEGEEDN